jgi:hypothetical protein
MSHTLDSEVRQWPSRLQHLKRRQSWKHIIPVLVIIGDEACATDIHPIGQGQVLAAQSTPAVVDPRSRVAHFAHHLRHFMYNCTHTSKIFSRPRQRDWLRPDFSLQSSRLSPTEMKVQQAMNFRGVGCACGVGAVAGLLSLAVTRILRWSAQCQSVARESLQQSCLGSRESEIMAGLNAPYIMGCKYIATEIMARLHSTHIYTAVAPTNLWKRCIIRSVSQVEVAVEFSCACDHDRQL